MCVCVCRYELSDWIKKLKKKKVGNRENKPER